MNKRYAEAVFYTKIWIVVTILSQIQSYIRSGVEGISRSNLKTSFIPAINLCPEIQEIFHDILSSIACIINNIYQMTTFTFKKWHLLNCWIIKFVIFAHTGSEVEGSTLPPRSISGGHITPTGKLLDLHRIPSLARFEQLP
jgi:hypothetical protein